MLFARCLGIGVLMGALLHSSANAALLNMSSMAYQAQGYQQGLNNSDPNIYASDQVQLLPPDHPKEGYVLCIQEPCIPNADRNDARSIVSNIYGGAGAEAAAFLGHLHAVASYNVGSSAEDRRASATATWHDILTIDKAGLTGQAGRLTFTMQLKDGSLSVSGLTNQNSPSPFLQTATPHDVASWTLTVAGGISSGPLPFQGQVSERLDSTGLTHASSGNVLTTDQPYEYVFNMAFVFGQRFALDVSLNADCTYQRDFINNSTGGCLSDVGHSAYWGGTNAVSLANGSTFTDYLLTSDTNTDWRQSFVPNGVPEPDTIVLLGAGLLGILLAKRKIPARIRTQ